MRTDAVIDRKQVKLPYIQRTGSKYRAQFGDMILTKDASIGRVIGRVHYAPALDERENPVKDWLLVIMFSKDLTFVMERWINPEWVTECWTPRHASVELYQFMLGDELKKHNPDELRKWSSTGFVNITQYEFYRRK